MAAKYPLPAKTIIEYIYSDRQLATNFEDSKTVSVCLSVPREKKSP